jgi:hypothetical protein
MRLPVAVAAAKTMAAGAAAAKEEKTERERARAKRPHIACACRPVDEREITGRGAGQKKKRGKMRPVEAGEVRTARERQRDNWEDRKAGEGENHPCMVTTKVAQS